MNVSCRFECPTDLPVRSFDSLSRILVCFIVLATSISYSTADEAVLEADEAVLEADEAVLEADETVLETAADHEPGESVPRAELALPQQLPDGRSIRTIGLYQSQMVELIPKSFHPIKNDRLIRGIADLAPRMTNENNTRLVSAVYWIDLRDGLMVSRRSEVVIDTSSESIVKHSLGPVNFAIESPTSSDSIDVSSMVPRLENRSNGDLVAVYDGRKEPSVKLPFRWQLHGQHSESGHDFDLKLPQSPQTRIVLSVPPRINIEALDGVLRRRSGPPPDAGTLSSNDQKRWFELDAGGLDRVRIRSRRQPSRNAADRWIVRDQSIEYQVRETGINWVCHVRMQAPEGGQFPVIQFRRASVSKVIVNAYDVPFTSIGRGIRRNIRIDPPDEAFRDRTGFTTVSIHGTAPFRSNSQWIDLPTPRWLGNVEIASTVDQIQMLVPDDLEVIKWNLPDQWIPQVPLRFDGGALEYVASGPYSWSKAPAVEKSLSAMSQASKSSYNTYCASVRIARRSIDQISETTLRIEMAEGSLNAHARLAVKNDIDGVMPLKIRVEPNWEIESVSFVNSSRVVERPRAPVRGGIYTLWPEPEDFVDGEIILEIVGSRMLDSGVSQLTIPATWFVAPNGMSDNRFVALVRPNALNWTSNAAVENEQIGTADISETARIFLGVLSSDTLLFRPEFGRSPAVSLRSPIASFDAHTQFFVFRDRDEIQESVEIDIESSGKPLQQIVVQAGPNHGRPSFVWSLNAEQGSPEIRLPSSTVSIRTDTPDETYSINLSDRNLSGHRLIGRRRYVAKAEQTLSLPTIPAATSVRSQAWIGAGLAIIRKPRDVHTIMVEPTDLRNVTDLRNATGLRYGHVRSPSITLAISDRERDVAIVRDEHIEIVASSRGVDRINASYEIAPSNQSVRIQYEPNLRLVSLIRNDSVVDLESIPQQYITIPPRSETEVVRLTFNRDQYENRWIRRCNIPRISASGIVLNSQYQLIPASDAFAPTALVRGDQTTNGNYSRIDLRPGDSVMLIRRNVVLASGWLFSILVFAFAWIIARRNAFILAGVCIVFTAALLLWWPWKAAIIGWLIVPIVSAAMLATSRWSDQDKHLRESRAASGDRSTAIRQTDGSVDFSVETIFRIVPWLVLFIGLTSISLTAQEPPAIPVNAEAQPEDQQVSDSQTKGKAINVLVPVDKSGDQVGEFVYVENSLYKQLVRPPNFAAESSSSFQSAEYRVRITTDRSNAEKQKNLTVEATYVIHLDRDSGNANQVKFPFAGSSVHRIELLGELGRLIKLDRDKANSVIAHLPKGKTFQLRVTLYPKITQSETWHRLEIPIPRVSASRLTVESSSEISQVRVGGSQGVILSREDRQDWSAAIGPQDRLIVEHPAAPKPLAQKNQSLQPRYLVDVGRHIATIDCQLDPPTDFSAGNTFQFVVRSNRLPLIVSKRWKLQKQELMGSALRRFTVESTDDQPGPIQLLWTVPIDAGQMSPDNPTQISIPEVAATNTTKSNDAWVGLRCDPGLQFAPLIGDDIESLSVDHFKGQWRGRQIELDRAFVAISEIPSPIIQLSQQSVPTIRQQNHLHVTSDQLELEFNATLAPADAPAALHSLAFPSDSKIRSVIIDGRRQQISLNQYPNHTEVLLRGLGDSELVQIYASAIVPIASDGTFTPPSISVTGASVSSNEYLISRDPAIAIEPTQGPISETGTLTNEIAVDWLRRGWSPLLYWRSDIDSLSDNRPLHQHSSPDSEFQMTSYPIEFDCRQVLSVDRDDLGWFMEANIHFNTDQMPDVVDIEAPSQWCDSLEVEGALQWIQLGEDDANRNIIRIRYDKESVSRRSLTIRGRLAQIDSARLAVPKIQVIGPGKRQVYLDIPDQALNGEPLAWQTVSVESVPIPPELAGPNASKPTNRSTFLAANLSWSIELQTAADQNLDPIAFVQDCNVLSQSEGALVHCRWDLYPGNLDSVKVRVDKNTTALAAWCAGRAVEFYPEGNPLDLANENSQLIRIPLSVSRLAQSVEVLFRVSPSANGQEANVPLLQGIPIERHWLVQHSPDRSTNRHPLSPVTTSFSNSNPGTMEIRNGQRLLSLAASIVDSIDSAAVGSGQSRREIAGQSHRWLSRFGSLRQQADVQSATKPVQSEWREIESRLVDSCLRQGMDESNVAAALQTSSADISDLRMSEFANSMFRGFRIENISELAAINRPDIAKHVSSSDRGLNTLITNCLTMTLIAGVLACLVPFYKYVAPIADHPAFWLGLLGVFGLAIAPTYVAAALVLLAIALPVFPAKRRVSQIVG